MKAHARHVAIAVVLALILLAIATVAARAHHLLNNGAIVIQPEIVPRYALSGACGRHIGAHLYLRVGKDGAPSICGTESVIWNHGAFDPTNMCACGRMPGS